MADLVITQAEVLRVSGKYVGGFSGAALTIGQVVYKDAADANKYKPALSADIASVAESTVAGITLNAVAAAGQPIYVLEDGEITLGASASVVQGLIYVLSNTAGGMCPAADLGAEDYVVVLGVGTADNGLAMNVFNSGVNLPAAP